MTSRNVDAMATLAFLLLVVSTQARAAGGPANDASNAILIGWDGAGRERLAAMLAQGELPNLKRLVGEGSLVATEVTTGNTQTKPGWAEILTGLSAVRLGIVSNKVYGPIPEGSTIFERLGAHLKNEGMATIFIAGKADNVGMRGPHQICLNALTRDPVTHKPTNYKSREGFSGLTEGGEPPLWVDRAGEPFHNIRDKLSVVRGGLGGASNVGREALAVLEKYRGKRFFAFVHFQEPDEQGHLYGEASRQYADAMKAADSWLGFIMGKLKALGIYDKTIIYVTTDHGMDPGEFRHTNAPHTFLAVNGGRKLRDGDRKDVAPTILEEMGIDISSGGVPLDGESLLQGRIGPLKVGYFLGGRTVILMRIKEAGEFEAGGVPVEFHTKKLRGDDYHPLTGDMIEKDRFSSKVTGIELLEGLLAGRWDLATIGESSFLAAVSSGSPIVAVAALGRDVKARSGHLFALRKGVRISGAADYRGKLFVSRRAGPGDAAFLLEFLRREGVDTHHDLFVLDRLPANVHDKQLLPSDKVLVVHQVFEDDLATGLSSGVIDGGFFHLRPFEHLQHMLERGKPLHEWSDPALSQALLVCTRRFLRDPASRFRLEAFLRVYRVRVLAERALSSRQRMAPGRDRLRRMDSSTPGLNYPQYDGTFKIDAALLSKMDALLREHGMLSGPVSKLDDFIDNSIAEAVLEETHGVGKR